MHYVSVGNSGPVVDDGLGLEDNLDSGSVDEV